MAECKYVLLLVGMLSVLLVHGKHLEDCEKIIRSSSSSPNEVFLKCNLRTINNEFDKVRFSGLSSSDSLVGLSLLCSSILFYQSSLPPASFSRFSALTSLSIEHCKLSRLDPGVFSGIGLKNLTINTHNTAWPALSLELSAGLFNIPTLERIDLSQNNIWTFPESMFCPAFGSLAYLNVSVNRLQDIGDLGFRDGGELAFKNKCKMSVQVLDISHNRLILLPSKGLAKLPQLSELYLQGNEISVLSTTALANLRGLKVLNLSENKISNLPAQLFQECLDLTEIYLTNNSLSALSPTLFSALNQLVVLDLSHNSLTSLSAPYNGTDLRESFSSGLIRLVLFNLGYNQLSELEPESFQNLYSVQVLNLEHNQIQVITGDTFSSMNNLHTLILSNNRLSLIEANSLNGLFVLSQLSIDNNNISGIHHDAFHNCSSLKDLNLNGNALANVDKAIQNLTLLKTIDLGENQLDSTPILAGLPNLYGLRLTGNRLVNISKDAFKDLASLKILNLARNQLRSIEEGAFDYNLNLQALRLDANYLTDISNLFPQCPNLIWLNISDNQLTWFDYALIPKQLQWIDVHKNSLGDLGNYFQRSDLRLQTLDASFNRITSIRSISLPDSLEMIFLNDNLINRVEPHAFYKKANLSRVDIFGNQIETLELAALTIARIPDDKPLPEMYLAGNPIQCDCNSEWLQRMSELEVLRQHFKIVDLDSVYCRLVHDIVVPLSEVNPSQFLCPYSNHCFNLCECCEYNACDCQQQCPDDCDCFNDDVWSTNIVDCSAKGHHRMPAQIPMDASQLYLDGNVIEELPSHALIGRKSLQILHLNHSGLVRIANGSLSGLKRLEILHLEHNYIGRLEGFEFKDLSGLKELYLQNNRMSHISNDTFQGLIRLEILRLDQNKLSHFTMWSLSENSYLIDINLSYNEWSCECGFLAKAAPWVQANLAKISEVATVNCELHGRPFSLAYMNGSRCADLSLGGGAGGPWLSEASDSESGLLPIVGIILAVCALVSGLLLVVCKRRGVWTVKCGQCYKSSLDVDDEKLYDAYVSYSLKDESWVNQILANELESHDPPYRLCLHYKFPDSAYVSDTIVEAVESSKRTIIVLSKNFIQGEWCRFEFKSALHSALCGKKVVTIILGDIPSRDLDPELRILIRSSTALYANEKLFLSKLKASLSIPRPPYSTHSRRMLPKMPRDSLSNSLNLRHEADEFNNGNYQQILNNGFYNPYNTNTNTSNFSSNVGAGMPVPVFVPPFPPPNRPPPPFPPATSMRRAPPPTPPTWDS